MLVIDPVFGGSTSDSLASYDPALCLWKTSQLWLLGGLTTFSEPLPRSGTMRAGTIYRLRPSAPLTGATGSSWSRGEFPTPTATPYGSSQNEGQVPHKRPSQGTPGLEQGARRWPTPRASDGPKPPMGVDRVDSLPAAVKRWPTPTAAAAKSSGSRNTPSSSSHPGLSLTDAVREDGGKGRTWPTPKASPSGPDFARASRDRSGGDDLATSAARSPSSPTSPLSMPSTGQLSPTWVCWLMGFPLTWLHRSIKETLAELRQYLDLLNESPSE